MAQRISLALQGGGAHGAFTWGVLDRILAGDELEIAAISGTSAGALNGAALKAGLIRGGREAAREGLRGLWEEVAGLGDFRRLLPWFQPFLPAYRLAQDSMAALLPFSPQAVAAQVYSPYAWGEAWVNPLARVIDRLDFDAVGSEKGPSLFVSATNVRSGKAKIFSGGAIGAKQLMASACLPTVFQAVEIEGESYWDGGYTGNPPLWPLYRPDLPDDIVIVHVNPLHRDSVPESPADISERIGEISFTTPLLAELRSVAFVKRLLSEGRLLPGSMRDLRMHMIHDDALMTELSGASKLQPGEALITRLFEAGFAAAEGFFAEHGSQVGRESSVDLAALFTAIGELRD